MDYEIVWTEPATEALEEITRYLAERNPDAAEKVANAITARVELLRSVPLLGTVYPRGAGPEVRTLAEGKYRIFYRTNEEAKRVEVLLIWHSARPEPQLPD
jgi:plasmid stabilization system protein ParE